MRTIQCREASQALKSFSLERRMRSDLIVRDIVRSNKNVLSFPISNGDV